jgi:hypothetical protein
VPISSLDAGRGFECRTNRNNAGYDEDDAARADSGRGRVSVSTKIPKEGEGLMSEIVGDFLVKRLSEWGVKRIFGYPGDGITGIMGALHRAGNDPELIQVRHEEMASLMACAHAKFTGEVGVCLATSGPGAIHLLNGLYDAKMDHRPVVAIVGQQALASLGGDYQQEVDLTSLRTWPTSTCMCSPTPRRRDT